MTDVDFGGLRIAFDDRLLRPREWTQAQSRWAAELLPGLPAGAVLEVCAGAGHIGLLAVAGSPRRLVCVDVNPVAAGYIAANADAAGVGDVVEVRTGRIAEVLGQWERFPMIIADPPWVRASQTGRFPEDPVPAIDGGADGMVVIRECVAAIAKHLAPGGVALLQLAPGNEQADAVTGLLPDLRLVATERRSFERGVLLRIDHLA